MTYAPASLLALRTYLIGKTHMSGGAIGIVGDAAHAVRATYHNGWDRFLASGLDTCRENYTICTVRDRALPHTNAAAAIDIGSRSTDGYWSPAKLRSMSVWLVRQARANAPGTRDMREIIYSPDGTTVLRWDRERGVNSAPRAGEADSTHRYHTHISFYRDSEKRAKLTAFQAYFDPDDVPMYSVKIAGRTMTYTRSFTPIGDISGLTVVVAQRIRVSGHWLYRIVKGKYTGRYIAPTSQTTFTRIED